MQEASYSVTQGALANLQKQPKKLCIPVFKTVKAQEMWREIMSVDFVVRITVAIQTGWQSCW